MANRSQAAGIARAVSRVHDLAAQAGVTLSSDELTAYEHALDAVEEIRMTPNAALSPEGAAAWKALNGINGPGAGAVPAENPGARFTNSAGFKEIGRGERWSTGLIPVTSGPPMMMLKGTLGETANWGGGAFVSVPQVIPGVVDVLHQAVTVESCLGSGQATTSSVRYIAEGTAISGAAGVLEGGEKPESTLGFEAKDEAVRKIATMVPISEELLDDAPSVQTFVNQQLILFVQLESERQLLRGDPSGGAEVQGLLNGRGVPIYQRGTADGRAEQLFRAMNSMRGSAFVEPDWTLINPADYEAIRLSKDANGQLFGGGPFTGPYGGPQGPVSASGQVTGATDSLWSKPCYVTSALGPGTAVVGSRSGATVWNRGGVSCEASNSHADFFKLNLVAIRAERRLALAVYRPKAFVEVRFG